MSARAYKIQNIDQNDSPSFNITRQYDLIQFFKEGFDINFEEQNIIYIPVEAIIEAIKLKDTLSLTNDQVDQLNEDIKGLDKYDDVQYMIY